MSRVVFIVAGAAVFTLLWLAGAGTIALACGVLFVVAEMRGLASLFRRQLRR